MSVEAMFSTEKNSRQHCSRAYLLTNENANLTKYGKIQHSPREFLTTFANRQRASLTMLAGKVCIYMTSPEGAQQRRSARAVWKMDACIRSCGHSILELYFFSELESIHCIQLLNPVLSPIYFGTTPSFASACGATMLDFRTGMLSE